MEPHVAISWANDTVWIRVASGLVPVSWKAVLGVADAAMQRNGWTRSSESLGHPVEGRYAKEVGHGFAAIVHLDPGEGATVPIRDDLTPGELVLGEGVELVVSATYLPAEQLLEDQGYARSLIEISDPNWDVDAHMLSMDRLERGDQLLVVTDALTVAAAAAERFALAHASPLTFVEALWIELDDEWADVEGCVAAPAVLVAAGLLTEARTEIDRARAHAGPSIPEAFWDHLDPFHNSGGQQAND